MLTTLTPQVIQWQNISRQNLSSNAKLVVDYGYTYVKSAEAVNVSYSAITRWVIISRALNGQGKTPTVIPLTPEQLELREMKKKSNALK